MRADSLKFVVSPVTHEPLRLEAEPTAEGRTDGVLVGVRSGRRFSIRAGIPEFVRDEELAGSNRKYGGLYDRIAFIYDWQYRAWSRLFHGGEERVRRTYLSELETGPGARVLDVSVGTGADLRFCPREAVYYGVDISQGMLRRCVQNLRRWRFKAELFRALAEALPFRDETFDAVFHAGGINYFSDKSAAVREMVRVARPGAKIVIVDATKRLSRVYEKVPIARRFVQERAEIMVPPVGAVPAR